MNSYCGRSFGVDIQLAEIERDSIRTLLCLEGEQLAGYAQIWNSVPPDGVGNDDAKELRRLYVAEEWHGLGLAQQLIDASISIVSGDGSKAIWLAVWENNPRAIGFYNKMGFVEVGEQAFYLGSDRQRDIIMALSLNPSCR
ncbi:GNAT family N-acetyltransferase [Halioglobus maricola]|nr:GNAT family N-acetyltransferase [Halioglobus maricola]